MKKQSLSAILLFLLAQGAIASLCDTSPPKDVIPSFPGSSEQWDGAKNKGVVGAMIVPVPTPRGDSTDHKTIVALLSSVDDGSGHTGQVIPSGKPRDPDATGDSHASPSASMPGRGQDQQYTSVNQAGKPDGDGFPQQTQPPHSGNAGVLNFDNPKAGKGQGDRGAGDDINKGKQCAHHVSANCTPTTITSSSPGLSLGSIPSPGSLFLLLFIALIPLVLRKPQ